MEEDSLCAQVISRVSQTHKRRSQVRHLSQTEVGSVEKDIEGLVRLGRGAIGRDPREFSEPTVVNKVKYMWPQAWLQVLMQAGLWSFPIIIPRKSKPPVS